MASSPCHAARVITEEAAEGLEAPWMDGRHRGGSRWGQAVAVSTAAALVLTGAALSVRSSQSQPRHIEQDQTSALTMLEEEKSEEGKCQFYHCGVFNPRNKCQCNAACDEFKSCCSDYKAVCIEKKFKEKPMEHKKVPLDPDMVWQTTLMRAAMKQQMALASGKEAARTEQEEHLEAAEKAMLARQKAEDTSEEDSQMPTEEEILKTRQKETEKKQKKAKQVANATNATNITSKWHGTARASFLDSLADLLGGSPKEEKKLKKAATKIVLAREQKDSDKVDDKKKAEEEEKEKEKEKKEEEEEEEEEAAKNKLEKVKKEAKEAIDEWKDDEKNVPNVSLYCFSLMMPFGYEPKLLLEQKKRSVGIYACNEAVVFSNVSTLMSGAPSPVHVELIGGSLAVAYGGRWMTALNTGVFNRLWMEVIKLQRYRFHDWSVKVDPDAVFFANRLRQMLRHKEPYKEIPHVSAEPGSVGKCSTCRLQEHSKDSCASHVRWWQQKGHSCPEALQLASRQPPMDCGCECDDFACDLPDSAVYLNNCKWGLHGPIEVLSRRAVATFAAGLPRCIELLSHPWGEDKFLDQCLQLLGVNRDNEYSLLSETACGEQPAPCGTSNVAFHPFKSIQSYFTCHAYADKYGHGPAIMPTYEEFADKAGVSLEDDDDEDDES